MPEIISVGVESGTLDRQPRTYIPVPSTHNQGPCASSNPSVPHLSNSAYSALVQSLAPLTITRDQAALIQALLSYRSDSIDEEARRQESLRQIILHL